MFGQLLSAISRARRVPRQGWKTLTGKNNGKYYKGKGAMQAGMHDSRGNFILLEDQKPKYIVPNLEGFALKPYVAHYILKKEDKVNLGIKTLSEKMLERGR
jgi:large subunit ribosomal protein L41